MATIAHDVNLLGRCLGAVIREQEGPRRFTLEEEVRLRTKDVRERGGDGSALQVMLAALPLRDGEFLVRAFSLYFQLVNLAEEQERIRQLRSRPERPEGLEAAFRALARSGHAAADARALVQRMIPGVSFGFSQPISDNVEEAVSGVKGQIAVKVLGQELGPLDDLAEQIARAIADVPGVVDLGVLRELGQSNANIGIARERIARYGLSIADVEQVIETGIGGRVVSEIIEGEQMHDLVLRFRAASREDVDALRRLPVPLPTGTTVPLSELADIAVQDGAARIYRENNRRFIAVKFGVRDRDLGSTVAEAQKRVHERVELPAGYHVSWEGEFESARRASRRLAVVVPATIVAVFVLLFAMFRGPRQPTMILVNVLLTSPLGGLAALAITGTSFSVSAGVGFLALFGVSVQTGVILVSYIDDLRMRGLALDEAIVRAAELRLRAIVMTALVATLGLLPAATSTGIGSDSQRPLAIVVVGGLISSLLLSMLVLPLFYRWWPGSAGSAQAARD